MDQIKGVHRFINDVIQGKQDSPTKSVLVSLFNKFINGEVKDYVYSRIRKPILLELALCILQEIGTHGIAHAKTLQLKVVKTSARGREIVIDKDQTPEFPLTTGEASFLSEIDIDEAIFNLSDALGRSPDVTVHSGQGRKIPYIPPDANGYFTPKKDPKNP